MEIYRLYELIKKWEEALTTTKPSNVQSIKLNPIIEDEIEYYGEGKIYGTIKLTLERSHTYTQFTIIDIYKEYRTIEEKKESKQGMVLCLIDFLEQFFVPEEMELIWKEVKESDLEWSNKLPC